MFQGTEIVGSFPSRAETRPVRTEDTGYEPESFLRESSCELPDILPTLLTPEGLTELGYLEKPHQLGR